MRQLRPGSKHVIRDINRTIILNLIKQHGTTSRVELADLSSLASPTITEIVAGLLDEGLIVETGSLVSDRRGPRPVLLELNRQGGYAVGIMLRPDGMNLVVTDLLAEVVYGAYQPLPSNIPPATVLEIVAQTVRKQVGLAQIDWAKILGLGVGVTGVIDSSTGICHQAYILGWHDVRIGETLEAVLEIPVRVDNDTRTLTIAEQHFGISHSRQNFVLVTVGRGVGMGAVVNGELLRGHHDIGAEFGHITMALDGPQCLCGKRGCLEAIASDVGIVQAASSAGLVTAELATIEAITERARAGDTGLRQIFHAAGSALGMGLANLINIFGPELVVLTGEGLRAGDLLLGPLHQALAQCVFGDRLRQTEIAIKPWAPDWEPWARGAASLVLDDLLSPALYDRRPFAPVRSAQPAKATKSRR
jgi:predicted NBD/HSP70 family sugar kinase